MRREAHQGHRDIGKGRQKERADQDAADLLPRETEMRRIERDDLEAYESPGRQDHEAEHAEHGMDPLRAERMERIRRQPAGQAKNSRHDDACRQDEGQDRVQPLQDRLRRDEQQTDAGERQDGRGDFAHVDPAACDRIREPGLDAVAQDSADDDEQRAAVQEHDRQIGKA